MAFKITSDSLATFRGVQTAIEGLKKAVSGFGQMFANIETRLDGFANQVVTYPIPIAKGGTGQITQTPAFDALAPTTTTGDLIYFDGTDNVRLGIGSSTEVLTVTGGAPVWATAGGGGSDWTTLYKYENLERNSDVLLDDPDFIIPVTAGLYAIEGYIGVGMLSTEGFKFTFEGPTASRCSLAYGVLAGMEYQDVLGVTTSLPAAAIETMIVVTGTLTFDDPGDLSFQWAQDVDTPATMTKVFRGSWIKYKRLSDL